MANTFAEKVTTFSELLDEKYQKEAITSILEVNPASVSFIGAKTVRYPKIDMSGLSNYNRATGFVSGDVDMSFGTHELEKDRGTSFQIDVMDDDELMFTAFGNLVNQFLRTKVIPEIDADRFAKIATLAGLVDTDTTTVIGTGTAETPEFPGTQLYSQINLISNVVSETISVSNVLTSFDLGEEYMGEEEVGMENVVMFVSNPTYKAMKQNEDVVRRMDVGTSSIGAGGQVINRAVSTLDGMTDLLKVPKNRFFDSIDLSASTTGKDAGYTPSSGAKRINYILMDKNSVLAITKHSALRYFAPSVNQNADAHKIDYRIFHDTVGTDNKIKAIYVSKVA